MRGISTTGAGWIWFLQVPVAPNARHPPANFRKALFLLIILAIRPGVLGAGDTGVALASRGGAATPGSRIIAANSWPSGKVPRGKTLAGTHFFRINPQLLCFPAFNDPPEFPGSVA
jgi:hypothetical protein